MAASTSTITTKPSGHLEMDNAVLTLSDGETYITRLSNPTHALLTQANSDAGSGSAINLDYTLSGRTFTIRFKSDGTAVTDKKVAMVVFGRK